MSSEIANSDPSQGVAEMESHDGGEVSVAEVAANLTPEQKASILEQAQQGGEIEVDLGDAELPPEDNSAEPDAGESGEPKSELEMLREENAKLKEDFRTEQLRNDRQGNKLGEQKKQIMAMREQLEQKIAAAKAEGIAGMAEDPFGRMEEMQADQQQLENLKAQESQIDSVEQQGQTIAIVEKYVGPLDEAKVNGIREMIMEDGYSKEQADAMNIMTLPPQVVVNLSKRAAQQQEINQLKDTISQMKRGRGDVLKNIDQAARNGRLDAGAGTSDSLNDELTPERIANMTSEERKAILKKAELLHSQSFKRR